MDITIVIWSFFLVYGLAVANETVSSSSPSIHTDMMVGLPQTIVIGSSSSPSSLELLTDNMVDISTSSGVTKKGSIVPRKGTPKGK